MHNLSPKILPSQEYLQECFRYDAKTGVLTWLERPDLHFPGNCRIDQRNAKYAHTEAGWLNKRNCYVYVSIDMVMYKAHRVIWKLVHGTEPIGEIDHKNGIRNDNRIRNLRLVTKSQNQRNANRRADNTSNFKNVSYHKKQGKYNARCTMHKKRIHIGSFDTPEQAYDAYVEYAKVNYGEFARV